MSVQVEKLEKSMAKLTITVEAAKFDAAVDSAYQKNKGKIALPGFRKGKAPRAMIEKMYGTGVFYEDAANELIPEAYETAAKESELEIVAQPEIEVTQMEKGTDFIFTATVAIKPEVTLGDYKGIEVEKKEAEVSEEEITAEIDKAREANSRLITIEDRATEDGDTVIIDFDGYVDGKQFEGGYAEDYTLVLGSHSFIDNFEDQLVGKNLGEDVEVNVTFPEEYHVDELKGKPALFKVKIKEIQKKELPELDDDFAQDVSDFDTLDEYKADVEKKILENKENQIKREQEDQIIEKIIENAQMEIPQQMITAQTRQMTQEFAQRLQSQGLSLEQYMQFTGLTPQKMMEDLEPQALKRIQSRLVLEAVVVAENIEASDEEIDKELENMAFLCIRWRSTS
jgi:trigger factor